MANSAPAGPWHCDTCGLAMADMSEVLVIWSGDGPAWSSDYRLIHTLDPAAEPNCLPFTPWSGSVNAIELRVLLEEPAT